MPFSLERLKPTTYRPGYPQWIVGKPLLIASSALASLGDAMFGYSQGIIASVQVQPKFIERFYGISGLTLQDIQAGRTGIDPNIQAITVSCLNITALLAALAAAYVCDILGRRQSVRFGASVYLVSAFITIFSPNLASLIVARCIQGIGVGFLSMTVPIIQAEIAPGHARGLFVGIEYLCLNSGYALSAWVGYAFFHTIPSEISWRGPYVVQAVLATVLLAWTFWLPETPRWLIKNGFEADGLQCLADLHGKGNVDCPKVRATYTEIGSAIALEKSMGGDATWTELFQQYKRRTIVGITSQVFAQLNGINALLYFLPENLTRAGFDVADALLYSGISAIIYVLGTVPNMLFVDHWGRKPFLLVGSVLMALCLATVGGLQYWEVSLSPTARRPAADGIFAGVCLYLFVFGASWGPVPWLLPAEIFPLRARARGMALATGANWLFNFAIAYATPPLFSALGAGYYFIIVGFVVISFFLVLLVYPETGHRTLEELGDVFGDNVVIKNARDRSVSGMKLEVGSGERAEKLEVQRDGTPRASFMTERTLAGSDASVKDQKAL
ncbi:sugar transporter 1 [Ramaria rubella]|nr:sugar transporter 1 [Ramaria rubella]